MDKTISAARIPRGGFSQQAVQKQRERAQLRHPDVPGPNGATSRAAAKNLVTHLASVFRVPERAVWSGLDFVFHMGAVVPRDEQPVELYNSTTRDRVANNQLTFTTTDTQEVMFSTEMDYTVTRSLRIVGEQLDDSGGGTIVEGVLVGCSPQPIPFAFNLGETFDFVGEGLLDDGGELLNPSVRLRLRCPNATVAKPVTLVIYGVKSGRQTGDE